MDKMFIRNLQLFANHGVFQEEKTLGQLFEISLEIDIDLKTAGKTDDLNESVNYGLVCKKTRDTFTEKTYDLIETAASHVARELLVEYPAFRGVKVYLKKPWAPIMMNLDTVEIMIERRWHRVFLSLGSNMGNKEENLEMAVASLGKTDGITVTKKSQWISTEAWGNENQDEFLNGAVEIMTYLEPEELLGEIQRIELELGRERIEKWGPRTMDIDIVLYEDRVIYDENLIVPHPYMHVRDFVLKPLSEIAPFFIHPVYKKNISELYEKK